MGLSVYYSFACNGSQKQVKSTLARIRHDVSKLPAQKIGPLRVLKHEDKSGWVFSCFIGNGCEPVKIGLMTIDGNFWRGDASTETQYAEHFYLAHAMVCDVLDICRRNGILNKVYDQGQFWETRAPKILAANINRSTKLMMELRKKLVPGGVQFPIDRAKNFMIVKDEEV